MAETLPTPRRKRTPVKVKLAAAVLLDRRGRTLVVKDSGGQDGALFSRMWQFPAVRVSRHAQDELRWHLRASLDLRGGRLIPLSAARHTVTFREITLAPFLVRVDCLPKVQGARAPLLTKLNRLPISSATRKIAAAALRLPSTP
jgi:adenine-specific DNA glycosylase